MQDSSGCFPLSRKAIDAWVEKHRDHLPTTLAELSRLPVPFRKAIARALEPTDHAGLWQEHLLTHVGASSPLSGEQQALVREAAEELPDVFAGVLGGDRRRLEGLKERIKTAFEPAQIVEIFQNLGPPEPEGGLPIPSDAFKSSGE